MTEKIELEIPENLLDFFKNKKNMTIEETVRMLKARMQSVLDNSAEFFMLVEVTEDPAMVLSGVSKIDEEADKLEDEAEHET